MDKWKIDKRKTVYSDDWVKLHVDKIASSTGAKTDYVYIERTGTGMAIVPYFEKSESVLLVKQYRHPLRKSIWQFPGGGKEKNKSFTQTAKLELLDETGYEVGALIDLGKYYPDPGISSDQGRIFLALNPTKKYDKPKVDPLEKIEIKGVKLTTLDNIIKSGWIRDGWTLGAYSLFKIWLQKK